MKHILLIHKKIKNQLRSILLWSQRFIHIDMVYLARGGFWTSVNSFFTIVASFIISIAFANLITPHVYGTYKYIMSISGALGFLTFSGMNDAVTQAVAHGKNNALTESIKIQLRWNLLFLIGSIIFGAYYLLQNNFIFSLSILILGIFTPLSLTFDTYNAFLIGKKDLKKVAIFNFFRNCIRVVSMIGVIFITHNIFFIIVAYSLSIAIPNIYFYLKTKKMFSLKNTEDERIKKEIFRYGGHLSFVNIFSSIATYIDKIVIFQSVGPVQLALYSFAESIPEHIKGVLKNIGLSFLPKLTIRNIESIKKVFHVRVMQGAIIGVLISGVYLVMAPTLFHFVYPQYVDSVEFSQALGLIFIFMVPNNYISYVFRSQKMIGAIYTSSIVTNVARIITFVIAGSLWGIWGIIYSKVIIQALTIFFSILYIWPREMKKRNRPTA